jgi:thermostable 8-oxoguanine DNA glycosylase
MLFKEQAESCRRQATQYVGRPEAPFLLRVASAFDDLAIVDSHVMLQGERAKSPRQTSNMSHA